MGWREKRAGLAFSMVPLDAFLFPSALPQARFSSVGPSSTSTCIPLGSQQKYGIQRNINYTKHRIVKYRSGVWVTLLYIAYKWHTTIQEWWRAMASFLFILQHLYNAHILYISHCTGTDTLPGSSALGILTVRMPSFNVAVTPVLSTCRGSQTVRVKVEVPTKERSVEIWFSAGAFTTAVDPASSESAVVNLRGKTLQAHLQLRLLLHLPLLQWSLLGAWPLQLGPHPFCRLFCPQL